MNMDRRVFLCIDLNIIIIDNRKCEQAWYQLVPQLPEPWYVLIPPLQAHWSSGFKVLWIQHILAYICQPLVTLASTSPSTLASFSPSHLGIILTISPWPPLEVWPSTSQQRWRPGRIIRSYVAKRSRPEEKTFCVLRKVSPPNHSLIISHPSIKM